MPIALLAAGIGAAGAVGGSLISSGASNHASDVAANAAAQNNALQQQTYASNKALEQPYIDAGTTANSALEGFLGLGGDPAASQKALNDYLSSTGYQFTRQQGLDAATQSKAAQGLLNSGAALKSLDAYGTGLANQYGQQYADTLSSVANRGANSANALAGFGQASANAQNANTSSAAETSAAAGTASASNINALIGQAVNLFGASRGQSSFGDPGAAYATTFNQPGYAPFTYSGG